MYIKYDKKSLKRCMFPIKKIKKRGKCDYYSYIINTK